MSTQGRFPLLEAIDGPAQLRQLPEKRLGELGRELREFLVESVSRTGGHLSANLGTIELTIALHYVFDTPRDQLIWDVGHQTYPHKILTGRREAMAGLRRKGGIAGFPKRDESEYDVFGVGHSSTSISAALGMAIAHQRQGERDRRVVAVIGDGALTAGMAYEALLHAGHVGCDMLVILNDNEMSISPNVGGLSNYLAKLLSGRFYSTMREGGKKVLSTVPPVWELAKRAEEHMKGMVVPGPGTLFEELGFNYIGPIDGHDIHTLVETLRNLRTLKGPQFLHVVTRKGKGYAPAEHNPCGYHGVSSFDCESGELRTTKSSGPSYTEVFGQWLCDRAAADPKLVGLTPAMREGSGMVAFSEQYPERFFDVGIAEQHCITLAAGLACEDTRPVAAIYSTFLQRAYDQLIHDVALQDLPVLFAIDRGGLVGPDGPTHAGSFDLSYLRCIPNMIVMAPADEDECYAMLTTGHVSGRPSAVRYPRGVGPGKAVNRDPGRTLPIGKAEPRRRGREIALLAFGSTVAPCEAVAEQLNATLINMRFVKPLDEDTVIQAAHEHGCIVTIEENAIAGGAGSAVNECLNAHGYTVPTLNLGIPDRFIAHGSRDELLAECGLDVAGIRHSIERFLQGRACKKQVIDVNS
ncbi:MAG: 1-deoxy-D-xylulose-5-phosphate synthase [Gammaproteobacteria bacterium]|nr:1-deoxy-D-xylulose-5-phosphate synthase [Gammaproteobacteria bacterium]